LSGPFFVAVLYFSLKKRERKRERENACKERGKGVKEVLCLAPFERGHSTGG